MNTRSKAQLIGFFLASASLTTWVVAQSVSVSGSIHARVVPKHDPHPRNVCPAYFRPIDLVICLDTSGSMTGLLNSARAKLWDIVNELTSIEPNSRLRVGLLTYGSPNNSTPAQGWIRRQTDLTSDLDVVYSKMMSLYTDGGDEFVGWVLNDAVHTMSWSSDPHALRLIYVAGNESADQAAERFNFRQVARYAREKGIVINSIFAGAHSSGIAAGWGAVARHGGGDYFAINQDVGTVQIQTPQDKILIELNAQLNATYVPYGSRGRAGKANQVSQDTNAAGFGDQTAASRVQVKASTAYRNEDWDLVDAAAAPGFEMDKLEEEALPAVMKRMSRKE